MNGFGHVRHSSNLPIPRVKGDPHPGPMKMRFRFAGAGPTMPSPGLWVTVCFAAMNAWALAHLAGA